MSVRGKRAPASRMFPTCGTRISAAHRVNATCGMAEPPTPDIDPLRAQHLALVQRQLVTDAGRSTVVVDETESPLAWLARRRGRGGQALIETHQLQAGERLRRDFTYAHLMPRTTSNLTNPIASDGRSGGERAAVFTDTMIAARQRVHHALDAVGPEFGGLLIDVCCFLKSLTDVERERAWPARSGKVVLKLALNRLARHYGYAAQVRGPRRAPMRTWLADDAEFRVEGGE
jgi:Domain of unknown function (DUF6456)